MGFELPKEKDAVSKGAGAGAAPRARKAGGDEHGAEHRRQAQTTTPRDAARRTTTHSRATRGAAPAPAPRRFPRRFPRRMSVLSYHTWFVGNKSRAAPQPPPHTQKAARARPRAGPSTARQPPATERPDHRKNDHHRESERAAELRAGGARSQAKGGGGGARAATRNDHRGRRGGPARDHLTLFFSLSAEHAFGEGTITAPLSTVRIPCATDSSRARSSPPSIRRSNASCPRRTFPLRSRV